MPGCACGDRTMLFFKGCGTHTTACTTNLVLPESINSSRFPKAVTAMGSDRFSSSTGPISSGVRRKRKKITLGSSVYESVRRRVTCFFLSPSLAGSTLLTRQAGKQRERAKHTFVRVFSLCSLETRLGNAGAPPLQRAGVCQPFSF